MISIACHVSSICEIFSPFYLPCLVLKGTLHFSDQFVRIFNSFKFIIAVLKGDGNYTHPFCEVYVSNKSGCLSFPVPLG